VDDRRKRQTFAATPAEPGDLPWEVRVDDAAAVRGVAQTDTGPVAEIRAAHRDSHTEKSLQVSTLNSINSLHKHMMI
jgi:hypothetical protein